MASVLSPIKIKSGETKYVQYMLPRDIIDVENRHFDALKINFRDKNGSNVVSPESVAPWLTMKALNLPAGLNISLDSGYVIKQIANTSESYSSNSIETEVRYREMVRVVLKVTADSTMDKTFKLVNLEFSDGRTPSTVPVSVSVNDAE